MSEEETPQPGKEEKSEAKQESSQTVTKTEPKVKKPKPKHRFLKWLAGSFATILLVLILVAGWYGFVPVLSSLMGANNPKDLGVTYTEADLISFQTKAKENYKNYADAPEDPTRPGKKVIFADPKDTSNTYTQEEVTARLNQLDWVYMPIRNVQVRFSGSDTVEVSGNINTDKVKSFINFIGGVGYSQEDVDTGLSWLKRMAGDPAIYIKANGSVTNNQLSMNIDTVTIGRWSAPVGEASKVLNTGAMNAITRTPGLDVGSATVEEGQAVFDGVAPTTIYVKPN